MTHGAQSPLELEPGFVAGLRAKIEAEMSKHTIPGLAIGLVQGDESVWMEGFGSTARAEKHPVTVDTPFSIQSAGKTYTATAFFMAASRGLVTLDQPLRQILPEFRVRSRWGDAELEKITFRHLLTHRSGLCHEAPVGNNYDHKACTFEEHIRSIADTWLKFPVGTRYSYSNLGMDLVAFALSRVSGETFPVFMRHELFGPVGMTSVRYEPYGNYARGHRGRWETPSHFVPMLGAGGFFISVRDVARFISFHLTGCQLAGKTLVRDDLLREMTEVQWPVDGQAQGFGLGLLIGRDPATGRRILYHPGGGYGYQTMQMWMPEEQVGVAVLLNQSANGGLHIKLSRIAMEKLIAGNFRSRRTADPKPFGGESAVAVRCEDLQRLSGTYRSAEDARTVRERRGALVLDGSALRPLGPTSFISERGDRITFYLDTLGRPLEMQILDAFGCTQLPLDHSPSDDSGPDRPEWRRYIGMYRVVEDGLDFYAAVVLRRGYLHVVGWMGDARLREESHGLFFTADGDSVEFRNGMLLWGSGAVHTKTEDALRELTNLAEIDPRSRRLTVGTLMRLEDAYRTLGDASSADSALELNLRLHPPASDRLLQLAEVYLGKMDDERAATLCRRVLTLEPGNDHAMAILAETQPPSSP